MSPLYLLQKQNPFNTQEQLITSLFVKEGHLKYYIKKSNVIFTVYMVLSILKNVDKD